MVEWQSDSDADGQLQWGHGREAMDGYQHPNGTALVVKLQWGHGREAMDGVVVAVAHAASPS